MAGSEGYVLIGIGERYLQMAHNLANTIKKNGDDRGVVIISKVDEKTQLYESCNTEFERCGTYPKITLDQYLPFDHNIFIDADALCIGDTQHVWDIFKSSDQFIQQLGILEKDPSFHGHKYEKELGHDIPRVHGGCIYINRQTLDPKFFPWMRDFAFPNYTKIFHSSGLPYKNSRPDQPIYGLASGVWGLKPLDIYNTPVMTVVGEQKQLPIKQVFFNKKHGPTLDQHIPFVHVFRGQEGMAKGYNRGDQKMDLEHYRYYLNHE